MMQVVHSRFNALLSACVLSLIATAGWSQSLTWLGTLGGSESYAYAVSANGVVVGSAVNAASWSRAFRWTASGGMQDLGHLGGYWSRAYGVSADGSVVVGQSVDGGYSAFRWTASRGMESLSRTYASLLTDGSALWQARAISPDGRYIVGEGGVGKAFLLDTGFPRRGDVDRNGCVDDADLLQVLFAFGGRGYRNEDLNWDGTVDDADLLEVLFNFGSGC